MDKGDAGPLLASLENNNANGQQETPEIIRSEIWKYRGEPIRIFFETEEYLKDNNVVQSATNGH